MLNNSVLFYLKELKNHLKKLSNSCLKNIFLLSLLSFDVLLFSVTFVPTSPFRSFIFFYFPRVHLTLYATVCAFSVSSFQFLTARCGRAMGVCGWVAGRLPAGRLARSLASAGVFLCGFSRASRQTVCASVLMCSVTLPLCLPATFCLHCLIPGGTATEREGDTQITSISL